MKAGWIIAGGVVAVIAYDLYNQAQAAKLLTFKLTGVAVAGADALKTVLNVTITINNPTSQSIIVTRVTGNISLAGQAVAAADTGILLKGITPGSTDITFPVAINNTAATAAILALLDGSKTNFQFSGQLHTPFISLPFNGDGIGALPQRRRVLGIYGFSDY